jgi:hypothetical protein
MFATQIEACNRVDVRSGDRVEDVRQPFVRLGSVAHAGFLLHDSARTETRHQVTRNPLEQARTRISRESVISLVLSSPTSHLCSP